MKCPFNDEATKCSGENCTFACILLAIEGVER